METTTEHPPAGTVRGFFRVDEARQLLRGWACDPAQPAHALQVDILVDSQPRATCLADKPRGDLARLDTGNIHYGFAFPLGDLDLADGSEHTIGVRIRQPEAALDGNCERFTARTTATSVLPSVSAHGLGGNRVRHEVQAVTLWSDRWQGSDTFRRQVIGLERNGLDEAHYYEQRGAANWIYRKTISDVELPDALVIMPFGIVIANGRVIHESTYLLGANATYPFLTLTDERGVLQWLRDFLQRGFGRERLPRYRLRLVPRFIESIPGTAFLLASPGYRSYYHWHIDTLPAITRLGKWDAGEVKHILCPAPLKPWHEQSLALLQTHYPLPCPLSFYGTLQVLRVENLRFTTGLGGNRSFLSPDICAFYEALTRSIKAHTGSIETGARLYLTRRSQTRRRLDNEAELEEALRRRGFSIVDPGEVDYATQIAMFRRAEVIVAPHGAALTNLIFCRQGVRVLELMPDRYINLGLQRIANLKSAAYGYIVGPSREHHAASTPHDLLYTVNIDEVLAMVEGWDSRT